MVVDCGVEGIAVFYDDDGFRDVFIYGSVALLAALALPSKKAHAAEFYFCGDGRLVEVTNKNREAMTHRDSCVTSWYVERQKMVSNKSGKPDYTAAPATVAAVAIEKSIGYQIQTSAIEPLTNAIEVPEGRPVVSAAGSRLKLAPQKRARHDAGKNKKTASAGSLKGLRHMGDGIYAE